MKTFRQSRNFRDISKPCRRARSPLCLSTPRVTPNVSHCKKPSDRQLLCTKLLSSETQTRPCNALRKSRVSIQKPTFTACRIRYVRERCLLQQRNYKFSCPCALYQLI